MAGSFGFEQDKLELSQALGERVLLPAMRAAGPDEMCWPMASPVVSRSHRASTIASPTSCRGLTDCFTAGRGRQERLLAQRPSVVRQVIDYGTCFTPGRALQPDDPKSTGQAGSFDG